MVAATSGLFWWSAETISILRPSTFPPKSSTAIWAARTEPVPFPSLYCPLMSVIMPMRRVSPAADAGSVKSPEASQALKIIDASTHGEPLERSVLIRPSRWGFYQVRTAAALGFGAAFMQDAPNG